MGGVAIADTAGTTAKQTLGHHFSSFSGVCYRVGWHSNELNRMWCLNGGVINLVHTSACINAAGSCD